MQIFIESPQKVLYFRTETRFRAEKHTRVPDLMQSDGSGRSNSKGNPKQISFVYRDETKALYTSSTMCTRHSQQNSVLVYTLPIHNAIV